MTKATKQSPALEKLTGLMSKDKVKKHPLYPVKYMDIKQYRDNSANALTEAIVDYIRYLGGNPSRINTQGQYHEGQVVESGLGYQVKTSGKWAKSGSTKGVSDIWVTFQGKSVAVEVKFGKDTLSEVQKEWRDNHVKAGGIYIVAKTFQQFFEEFNKEFSISI